MTMHSDDRHTPDPAILGSALSVAPAAIGCAVGLLLADRMKQKKRHRLASAMFTLGAIATLPLAIDYLTRMLDSPASQRGRRRRLDAIRESGVLGESEVIDGESFFVEKRQASE